MIRKGLFVSAGLVLLGLFLFGRHAASYVRTSAGWVRESVKDSVPIEFEIDRARDMIKNLQPEIRKNMHVIAKEEAQVERLAQQIAQAETKLAKDRNELARLKDDVSSGKDSFHYAGRTYTVSQVKSDLTNRFERYKTADQTINSLRDIHAAREKQLEAAKAKLEAMLAARQKLEAQVENLEARMKMVEVAQAANQYSFDDSQLGAVKEMVEDLQARIQVAEKMVHVEGQFAGEIPLEDTSASDDIVERVAEYLGEGSKEVKVAEFTLKKAE